MEGKKKKEVQEYRSVDHVQPSGVDPGTLAIRQPPS